MKVTIKETEKKTPKSKYPYIGINNRGAIVLFTSKESGVILKSAEYYTKNGTYSTILTGETAFTPFEGEIILSNG